MKRQFKAFCLVVLVLLFGVLGFANADVTIAPASPTVVNCYPFGGGGNSWTPYAGFVYQNVPAFNILPGDILAFDLGATNNVNIELDIAMAPTTANGGTVQSGSFVQVVSNTQTPANPTGDTTVGNFELQFTAEAPFSFPGGGLIIRFSNPSAAYATDTSCTQVLVSATSSDPSGFFVQRFYRDANGVSPWDEGSISSIGGFQVLNLISEPPPVTCTHTMNIPTSPTNIGTFTPGIFMSYDPIVARPFGLGEAGDILTGSLWLPCWRNGHVDVYLVIPSSPYGSMVMDHFHQWLSFPANIQPWMTYTDDDVYTELFSYLKSSILPGNYQLDVIVVPSGTAASTIQQIVSGAAAAPYYKWSFTETLP